MKIIQKHFLMAVSSTLLLAGCAGKIETAPSPLADMTPDGWKNWTAPEPNNFLSWGSLNDPALIDLIHQGLSNSLDMESAEQRLERAKLNYSSSEASRLPFVSASASASRSGELDGGSGNNFSASLSASYEVDIWGRRKQRIASSELNVQDAKISMQSARISLASAIADAYFNIRAMDKKIILQQKSLTSAIEQRKFVEARLKAGLVIRNDLDRQDVQIADLETNIEGIKSSRSLRVNSLAVMLGKAPGDFTFAESDDVLNTPSILSPNTPAEILRNRPDIKFQEISLAQSLISVDLVRTDLYPSFSLSTGANAGSSNLGNLFDVITLPWSVAVNAALPLLDGKARETQIKLAALGHEQVITSYKKTILVALSDVESALARQASIGRQKESFARKVASQQRVSRDTQEKYKAGKASAFDLLIDSNALIGVEQQEVDLWLSSVTSTVGLLRAFGIDPQ